MSINDILLERAKTHGDFRHVAKINQAIKQIMRDSPNWNELEVHHQEGLEYITGKMTRILCGNSNFEEHWLDIEGYAKITLEVIQQIKEGYKTN